jgi:hypothetical protein
LALRIPARRATPIAHRFSAEFSVERCRMTWAASYSAVRTPASPVFEIRPLTSVSPDWYFRGVRPNNGPTPLDDLNRPGSSIAEAKVSATIEPTPGTVVSSRARWSVRAYNNVSVAALLEIRSEPQMRHVTADFQVRLEKLAGQDHVSDTIGQFTTFANM